MELCMERKEKNLLWKMSGLAFKSNNTLNRNLLNKHDPLECRVYFSSPTNGKYGCGKFCFLMELFHQTFASLALF